MGARDERAHDLAHLAGTVARLAAVPPPRCPVCEGYGIVPVLVPVTFPDGGWAYRWVGDRPCEACG